MKSKNSTYNKSPDILCYLLKGNCFYCEIRLDDFRTCEFDIAVYTYKEGTCLVDLQELSGEHFTFSEFLECFKSFLREWKIAALPEMSKKYLGSYGLYNDICLNKLG